MGNEAKLLEDYLKLVTYGFTNPMPDADSGPWKITAKDVIDGKVNFKTARKTTQDAFDNKLTKKSRPEIGDVLLTKDGTLGRLAVVREEGLCINQSVAVLRPNEKIIPEYLFYLLSTQQYQRQMLNNSDGSVIKHIYITRVGKMEVDIPSIEYQKLILNHLSTIDSKIELNQQTNQTLEKMAQTLFKSWFVDFDPVFDNALAKADFNLENLPSAWPATLVQRATSRLQVLQDNPTLQVKLVQHNQVVAENNTALAQASQAENTHQHFPSEFELIDEPSIGINGWIPKGWEVSKLKEFGKVITGKTPPKKVDDAFDLKGIPFITPTDVEGDVFTLNVVRYLTESGLGTVKNNVVDAGAVCVTCIGSQMGKTIIASEKSVTNQQLNSIVLSEKYFRNYIFMNLRTRREELFNLGSSGSTMPILNKSSFENLDVLKPNESSLRAFSDTTERYLDKILLNSQQNEKLIAIRDTLLPKLISGELQIPDSLDFIGNDD